MAFPIAEFLPAAIAGVSSAFGAATQNNANRSMAREQMQFQERMSNTAYQRATSDMRASGINPMLAYMQGGASSPGGASAQMEDIIGPAVSSAQHQRRLSSELRTMDDTRGNINADTVKKQSESGLANMNTSLALQHIKESAARTASLVAGTRSTELDQRKKGVMSTLWGLLDGSTGIEPGPRGSSAKQRSDSLKAARDSVLQKRQKPLSPYFRR